MRIEGLPLDSGGLRNIKEKKEPATAPVDAGKPSDTVKITGGIGRKELVDIAFTVPAEFPVREEVLDAVSRRISSRSYDEPDMQRKVADRLIESPALSGSVNEAAADHPSPARTETIESAQARTSNGHYDQPEVVNATAERLIDTLGLGGLLGK